MKRMKRVAGLILSLLVVLGMLVPFSTAQAAESKYTYTVKIVLGGTGEEGSSFVDSYSDKISEDKKAVVFTGLNYNDEINFNPQGSVKVPDDGKYGIAGIKRSGENQLFTGKMVVTQDETYVVAYSVGEIVPYTVKYVADDGTFNETATYYGVAGEKVVVPYKYKEGYETPDDSITIEKLERNQSVTFNYSKVKEKHAGTVEHTTERTVYSTVTGGTEYTYQIIPSETPLAGGTAGRAGNGVTNNRTDAGQTTGGGNGGAGDADNAGGAGGAIGNTEIIDPDTPKAGEGGVGIPDPDVAKAGEDNNNNNNNAQTIYIRWLIIIAIIGIMVIVTCIISTYKIEREKHRKN